jgi:hypothetical protein
MGLATHLLAKFIKLALESPRDAHAHFPPGWCLRVGPRVGGARKAARHQREFVLRLRLLRLRQRKERLVGQLALRPNVAWLATPEHIFFCWARPAEEDTLIVIVFIAIIIVVIVAMTAAWQLLPHFAPQFRPQAGVGSRRRHAHLVHAVAGR